MSAWCAEASGAYLDKVRIVASSKRQLPDWSLAYAGESTYVANQIAPLLGPGLAADPERIDRLDMLIVAFASM